jgi:hypothetical protein
MFVFFFMVHLFIPFLFCCFVLFFWDKAVSYICYYSRKFIEATYLYLSMVSCGRCDVTCPFQREIFVSVESLVLSCCWEIPGLEPLLSAGLLG